MPSDIDIANLALTKLGATRITAFTDQKKEARSMNAIYARERDFELRAHLWSFSVKRAALPALSVAPVFGYDFAYELPADYLKAVAVGDFTPNSNLAFYNTSTDDAYYRIEGHTIVTDIGSPLNLRYVRGVTDPMSFDTCFVETLACRLAMNLAEDLSASGSKRQLAQQEYLGTIKTAIRASAIEQPSEPLASSSWLLSRLPGCR